ncbi:glycosyltransferase family 4 protein [Methylovirgula sp. 4M-Z18]|uniref:glycosyltransferase family 4 protein n=1 Tax=Methylovirgula sp. 4M-Z18 TaxID=2293567 RepID=UPI000E2E7FA8|nr:glycosyltransferase family 4 protein [Methylovirgula sp. 4M-Z18]RFB79324.1 glycosyltransferase family 1 protein [Methylovirgula sp. 4M-Z18]
MSACVFAIPGDLATPTGGYGYDRHVLQRLPSHGVRVRHMQLPASFPHPTNADLAATAACLADAAADEVLLIDALAYSALPETLIHAVARPIVALVHHPLALETGLTEAQQSALRASERAALSLAHAVVVTSPITASILVKDYAVPQQKISVAVPGVEPAQRAPLSVEASPACVQLLAVGSLIPRKGYDVLVRALQAVPQANWHLTIVGSADFSPQTLVDLRAQIAQAGLQDRISFFGSLSAQELAQRYEAAHVFVVPSLYEGYGMALTEALARGLPIVTTTGGALSETAPDSAALKVPPGDAPALARALSKILSDSMLRLSLADAAWAEAQKLPRWDDTASLIADVVRQAAR